MLQRIPQKASKKATHILDIKLTMCVTNGVVVNAMAMEVAMAKLVRLIVQHWKMQPQKRGQWHWPHVMGQCEKRWHGQKGVQQGWCQ